MNTDFVKRFVANRAVRGAARRFALLVLLIPGAMLLLLKSPLHPFVRIIGAFALTIVFLVLLNRANKAMNDHRAIMDAEFDRRRIITGKQPRKRHRWLKAIFPFYT